MGDGSASTITVCRCCMAEANGKPQPCERKTSRSLLSDLAVATSWRRDYLLTIELANACNGAIATKALTTHTCTCVRPFIPQLVLRARKMLNPSVNSSLRLRQPLRRHKKGARAGIPSPSPTPSPSPSPATRPGLLLLPR